MHVILYKSAHAITFSYIKDPFLDTLMGLEVMAAIGKH